MRAYVKIILLALVVILAGAGFGLWDAAAQTDQALKPYVESMEQARTGMTFWQLLQAGGVIMIILLVLSMMTLALIVYDFIILKERKIVPVEFVRQVIQKIRAREHAAVLEMSRSQQNVIARIVYAGLQKKKDGAVFAKEAMENCIRTEISQLWQNVSYLGDIASVAPLIGLLGTVIGMIQAFNVIAFQTAVVKPILLAGGVSKAMVTTAGGLIVAIPALIFYSYFRGKLQQIANSIEEYSSDLIKLISET